MASIMGSSHKIVQSNLKCVRPLSLNIWNHNIYWTDYCDYTLESMHMDGNKLSHSYLVEREVFFTSYIATLGDLVYWVEGTGIYFVNSSNGEYGTILETRGGMRLISLQVVHPSNQLPGINVDFTSYVYYKKYYHSDILFRSS